MFTKGFFGGGSKNKSEEAGPASKGTSKPAPVVKPDTYYNDSTDETLDESPEPPGNLEDFSKVIDVNSPEYYLQDDVPLRSNHDMPNPLNPPPINREHREQRPNTSGNKQKNIEPCSADDLRLKKHDFDIKIAFTCQKQGEASKSTRKRIDLNVELQRHEAGEQYEQQREHEEATLQVDFPDDILPKNRHPIKTWDDLRSQLAPEFLNIIKETYPSPNPLQCHAIPYMLSGQQIIVETPTGTGKTAAYLIPAVQLTLKAKAKDYGPQVPYTLIIGNTNNLMHQVFDLARKLIKFDPDTKKSPLNLRLFACFAAATGHVTEQTGSSEICVCTTGKLLDAVKAKTIRLDYIELLILDEADKMVSMTFGNEILQLHQEIVKQKRMRFAEDIDESEPDHPLLHYQVATFSATFNKQDDALVFNDVQQTIYRCQIPTHIHMAPGSLIEQRVIQLEPPKFQSPFEAPFWKRLHILLFLLDQDLKRQNKEKNSDHFANRTIVFVEKKSTCNFLTVYLTLKGYKFRMVNGDMSHRATQDVISELGDGHIQGVVATNKLARGADIRGIEHIIILEMAADFNDYLHRIGRTGRIGHEGRSTLIFDRNTDDRHANPLYECLRARNQTIPRWLFDYLSPTQLVNDDRRQVGEREEGGRESTADEESDRDAETVEGALERQQTTNFEAPFEVYLFNREPEEDDDLLELANSAASILQRSSTGRYVRQCNCNEERQCVGMMQNQGKSCSYSCSNIFRTVTSRPEQLLMCIQRHFPIIDRFVGCMQTQLRSCGPSGRQVPHHNLRTAFSIGESMITAQRGRILSNSMLSRIRPLVEVGLSYGSCVGRCFSSQTSCFDQRGCQPNIEIYNLRNALSVCTRGLGIKRKAGALCMCAKNAGVMGLNNYCSLLGIIG